MLYQFINKLKTIALFFLIMFILTLIYAIYLNLNNSSVTYNNELINKNYISFFIGLLSFFILGLLTSFNTDKKYLLNALINFLIVYFVVFTIKIINDSFNFEFKQLIKMLAYLFICFVGCILFAKKKV